MLHTRAATDACLRYAYFSLLRVADCFAYYRLFGDFSISIDFDAFAIRCRRRRLRALPAYQVAAETTPGHMITRFSAYDMLPS